MIPVESFSYLSSITSDRYSDIDIPITYGILLLDFRQGETKDYIINYLSKFHKRAGKYIDFYLPGYTTDSSSGNNKIDFIRDGKQYYFNADVFMDSLDDLEEIWGIELTYNPILILVETHPHDFDNSRKIVIELDNTTGGVRRAGILFNKIFEVAKKHVDVQEFQSMLSANYLPGALLETIITALDNKFITAIKSAFSPSKGYYVLK